MLVATADPPAINLQEFIATLQDPEVRTRMLDWGMTPDTLSGAQQAVAHAHQRA